MKPANRRMPVDDATAPLKSEGPYPPSSWRRGAVASWRSLERGVAPPERNLEVAADGEARAHRREVPRELAVAGEGQDGAAEHVHLVEMEDRSGSTAKTTESSPFATPVYVAVAQTFSAGSKPV